MSLPSFSIRRPVTVLMVTSIVLLFGSVSLTKLPVELYPNTSFGQISIIINVRGGIPPTEVESQVTRLVEDAVSTVTNLAQVISISKEGESTVVMSFRPGTDMDFAALEVREKFSKIKRKLPREIEKPVIAQFQQNDVPILIVSAISEVRSTEEIRKIISSVLVDNLKRVSGVANIEVAGGRQRKIIVDLDQVKMAAFHISLDEITSTLDTNNLNLLSGELERDESRILVRVIGEFDTVEMIKNMPLRMYKEGGVVRLRDVASVKDAYLEPSEYSRLNVRPVVTMYVQKESTKNTITVAREVLRQMEELKVKIPRDIQLVVTSDQSKFIEKAIDNLKNSLLQGAALIILVFFLFLYRLSTRSLAVILGLIVLTLFSKHWPLYVVFASLVGTIIFVPKYRPILVVTFPIPVSIIGTFMFMQSLGLSVNVMTLFGLALGAGMLVDNSIIVFENILKKAEKGVTYAEAAVEGSQEMYLSIVASTLTSVIVFLPLVFMGEELQRLYSGMAATIVISLLVSMICAITLVPMMSARKAFTAEGHVVTESELEKEGKGGWVKSLNSFERKYLFLSIRKRYWVLLGSVLLMCFSVFLMSRLGYEYLGSTEQNKFTIYIELPTGARLSVTDKIVKKVENFVRKIPEVKSISSRVESWSAKVYVELLPSTQRKRSVGEVTEQIRKETDRLRPAFIYFQEEEQVGTKEVIIDVYGHNYEKLRELAIAIANRMGQIKGLSDTKIRMREGRPEMQLIIDKKKAAFEAISVNEAANQIHGQMRGFRATEYHEDGKEIETLTRLDEKYRKTFKDLHNLVLYSKIDNELVVLDQISDFKFGLGPSEIWRKNKNRMIQVSANISGVPLSTAVEQLKASLNNVPFPEDYFYRVGGDYPTLIKSKKQIGRMVSFDLTLVYLVLASLFESFYQPVLIMVAVPLALIGAIVAMYIGPKSIGVGAMLGMMMLSGIVVNHSIMLLDRINFHRRNGCKGIKAAVLANKDRLRPILMTVSTTSLGLVPMAIDRTEGANLWSPLAMTVIGGIISSTILTLLVTPSFYVIAEDAKVFLKSCFHRLYRLREKIH